MPPQAFGGGPPGEIPFRRGPGRSRSGNVTDPVVQTTTTTPAGAQSQQQWEGLGAGYPGFSVTAVPPDPNIAVGPNHIVQLVNNAVVIFDKQGNQVNPPVSDGTFWGLLSTCNQLGGFSDPIVQFDRAANRWLVGEVAIPLLPGLFGQYAQCFAVSTTSDPAGSYYLWAYGFRNDIDDYPKIGVWPDGYYVTWNMFQNGATFMGARACSFDRSAMLSGAAQPARVCFQLPSTYDSLLPSDLDGPTPPPVGSPNFLMNVSTDSGALNLWKFHVDYANPSNSTFAGPVSIAGVAPFNAPCPTTQDCVPQPGTTTKLDALGDRLMYRLAYRNFGGHESIVANHTVTAPGGNTGIRWYEVRLPNGNPALYQQGSFAPDGDYRWMGSIAMDQKGNIGLGYSVSNSATYPSIRYAGWEVGNPLGTLQAETPLMAGGGAQTAYNRWGDYSAMRIDPSNDCTFWYTQEYQATTQTANWNTRIGSFQFPSCGQSSTPTTTVLTAAPNPSTYGQNVTFTATVSPAQATGTVQFFDGANSLGTKAVVNGIASLSTSNLLAVTHSITGHYNGDTSYLGSTSSALLQTVNQAGTTTALGSSSSTSAFGQQVTFTATVQPSTGSGTPTGNVTFKDGGATVGTSALNGSGVATFSTSSLSVGSHSITAQYNGDSNYSGSTSPPFTQMVTGKINTITTLTSSPNPSNNGQTVTFTATVSPSAASGTVQFFDGATSLGTSNLVSGAATLQTSNLSPGKHSITAQYGGDSTNNGSTSAVLSQNVRRKR